MSPKYEIDQKSGAFAQWLGCGGQGGGGAILQLVGLAGWQAELGLTQKCEHILKIKLNN